MADWIPGALLVVILLFEIAGLIGPFGLAEDERPVEIGHRIGVATWARGWRRRGREPLSFGEWMPHAGRMFLPWFATLLGMLASLQLLTQASWGTRLLGATVLAGAVLLLALIVGYVTRPVESHSSGTGFPSSRPGYRADEVDAFFDKIEWRTRDEVKNASFRMAGSGYDVDEVDKALAEWLRRLPERGRWSWANHNR